MAIKKSTTPLIKEGWQRAIIFCAAIILANWLTGIVAGGASNLAALLIAMVLSVGLTIVFRLFIDRQTIASIGFHTHKHRNDAWVGLLLAIVLLGIGSLILYFSGHLRWVDASGSGKDFFVAIIFMLIVAVSEEMVFRGYLLNNLLESFNKRTALIASALLFTVAHVFNPDLTPLALVNLFLGGILLGINFIYTRTLWFAIGFHFGWNFLQGYILGFNVSGFSEQTLLQQELTGSGIVTGAQFGFEGSIIATCVLALAIGALYYVYEKQNAAIKPAA